MQFTVDKEKLQKILSIISYQIIAKPALPILANILLEVEKESLKISATNLELGAVFTLEAKVLKTGKITLPAKTLTEAISSATGQEASFKLENTEVEATCQNSVVKLPTIPADEYPQIPVIQQGLVEIKAAALTQTLQRLTFAASQDAGRPILTGVQVEFDGDKIRLVATDGYRLSFEGFVTNKKLEKIAVVIPSKTLVQLARVITETEAGSVKILQDPQVNQMGFEVGSTGLISRLIDGTFPDWQKIIPTSFSTTAAISKTELLQAVKVASVFAKETTNTVKLIFSKDLEVQTQSGLGSSNTKIPAKITGSRLEIAFNWRYLQEALQAIPGDGVKIELVESLAPARFTPVKSSIDFFHIVMPVRI